MLVVLEHFEVILVDYPEEDLRRLLRIAVGEDVLSSGVLLHVLYPLDLLQLQPGLVLVIGVEPESEKELAQREDDVVLSGDEQGSEVQGLGVRDLLL